MPRRVDHAQRRREIVEATLRVVHRVGLEGTTTRAIADEAGCTLSVLAHFFGNKDAILVAAQGAVYERIVQRAFRIGGDLLGLTALRQALEAALPLDEERAVDAAANAAFAAAALTHTDLAEARRRSRQDIRRVLYGCLTEARELGELREGVDDAAVVHEFFVLAEGAALTDVLDPGDRGVDPRSLLLAAAFVERLRGPGRNASR
ncbi:TetR/AcrR family transcriptional regulator [Cellulomonas soli]